MGILSRTSLEALAARAASRGQLWRLAAERALQRAVFGRKPTPCVMATACWDFPIYSQTFVYQELTHLVRQGYSVRFLYAHLESRDRLPDAFSCLWRARRRLVLHEAVCARDYAYFTRREPEKVEMLIDLLASASGLDREAVRAHRHVRQAFAFARMVEAYRPDYLHSYFFYEGTLFAFVASYLLGIPRGVSCYADHVLEDYELKVVALHLMQCDVVVATSRRIKEELRQLAPGADADRIVVKPNAVDVTQFVPRVHGETPTGQPFRLVCACRIEPKKGLIYLVEAMAMLRRDGHPVKLHLLGAPDDNAVSQGYAQELDALIARHGLGAVVHREGRKTGAEVKAFFARSDLFVAPFIETDSGDKDGIPTVLLEAMAAGLPVVATDAGSITEVIDDGWDGFLVPQRDPAGLAKAISRLRHDAAARAAVAARGIEKIREKFDVSVCEPRLHARVQGALTQRTHNLQSFAAGAMSWCHVPSDRPPLVSGVIIFLNGEKYIREAIDSVLGQTYPNWELILVDDGSSDGSTALAKSYAARYPQRIRYLEHDGHRNRGMSASRNLGIRHARGKYVALLDHDDVWLPRKLEDQVAILEAKPEAWMTYGRTRFWFSWTGRPEDRDRDSWTMLGVSPNSLVRPPELVTTFLRDESTIASTCSVLFRRELMDRVGYFEDTFRDQYEDMVFWTKVYLEVPVYVSGNSWDCYRQHPESCNAVALRSGQGHPRRPYPALGRFLAWVERYVAEQQVTNNALHEALQAALHPYRCVEDQGPEERFYLASWDAGLALIRGEDPRSVLEAVKGLAAPNLKGHIVAAQLFEAVPMAMSRLPIVWEEQWPKLVTQIQQFLDVLECMTRAPGLRADTLRTLQRLIEGQWLLRQAGGNEANLAFPSDDSDHLRIEIDRLVSTPPFDLQLSRSGFRARVNHHYEVRFLARADRPRSLAVGFSLAHGDWGNLGLYSKIELTPEWQSIHERFVVTADDGNARLHFDLGGEAPSVELKGVTLRPLAAGEPSTRSLEPGSEAPHAAPRGKAIEFGSLRRLTPVSGCWGFDRGQPIDRYYINQFLSCHAADLRGHILEIGGDHYGRQFGDGRLAKVDVFDADPGNAKATIVGDLQSAPQIASNVFDCIVATQTLQFIYDVRAAASTLSRILKPGGVLLVTLPGISQTYDQDWAAAWCWTFTPVSARRLFEEACPGAQVDVQAYGNVLAAISFLHGLAAEELRMEELDYRDPSYPVLVAVRVVKPEARS